MKNEQNTTKVGNRPAVLRRWSVAKLIANGVPRPPAGQTAHWASALITLRRWPESAL
jgi:hypothetical protein